MTARRDPNGSGTDTVLRALAFEAVLGRVFERFADVADADFDRAVSESLAEIGAFVGADRSYVIRFDAESNLTYMTHEWCADGIPPSFEEEQAGRTPRRRSNSARSATSR